MSDLIPETPPANPAPAIESTDLNAEVTALREFARKLQTSLIALAWVFGIFLFIQVWRSDKDVKVVRQIAAQQQWAPLVQSYENDKTAVQGFLNQLSQYGSTNKQFQPLLQKYGIPLPMAAPAATAPAAAAPKPAAAPAAPPKK